MLVLDSAARKLTVSVEQFARLTGVVDEGNPRAEPLKDRLETLLGYRINPMETVGAGGKPLTVITLQAKQAPGSLSSPAMQEEEALRFLEALMKAEVTLTPERRRELVDAYRQGIIDNIVTRAAKTNITLEIVMKEGDKHGFKLESCSHADKDIQENARQHVRGELDNWKSTVRSYANNIARNMPVDIDTVVALFDDGPFKKFEKELRVKWELPMVIKVATPKVVEAMRAAVQFLPLQGGDVQSRDLLSRYVDAALRNDVPAAEGNSPSFLLAAKEYKAWQDYVDVFTRYGFDLRLINLPRDRGALHDVDKIPGVLKAKTAELAAIDAQIADVTRQKEEAQGKERKPLERQLGDLKTQREEKIIGLAAGEPVVLTHEEVLRLAGVKLPVGDLVFPALLLTQASRERFPVDDANTRMTVAQGVLSKLVHSKAGAVKRNQDSLQAYYANLERHRWLMQTLARLREEPESIRKLDGAQQKLITAFREKVDKFETGKRTKSGKALSDYLAMTTDPTQEPVMPSWDTVAATGPTSLESWMKKGLERVRKKEWGGARNEGTGQDADGDDDAEMSGADFAKRVETLKGMEAKQYRYNGLTFTGPLVVSSILGERGSNLNEAHRLCRVEGVKYDVSPDGKAVIVRIPVATPEESARQLQDLLTEMAVRARALAPSHMLTSKTSRPILSHEDVKAIYAEQRQKTADLSPAALIKAVVKEAGAQTVQPVTVLAPVSSQMTFQSEALANIINNPLDTLKVAMADWRRELAGSHGPNQVSMRAVVAENGYALEINPPPSGAAKERVGYVLIRLQNILAERTFVSAQDLDQARAAAHKTYNGLRPYLRQNGGRQLMETIVDPAGTPNIDGIAFLTDVGDDSYMEARITLKKGMPSYCSGKEQSFLNFLAGQDNWAVFEKDSRLKGLNIRTENNVLIFNGATPDRVKMAVDFFQNYVRLVEEHRGQSNFSLSTLLQVAMGKHTLPDPNSEAAQRGITTPIVLRNVVPNRVEPKSDNQRAYQYALDNYPVVIAIGRAGTGKGFLAGNESVQAQCGGRVEQIIWSNFMAKQGASLGALPGDFLQKLQFLYAPFIENYIKAIIGPDLQKNKALKKVNELMADSGLEMPGFNSIDILDPRFAMGRTFDNTNVYIDEAQLMPKNYIEVLMQRVGQGTKLRIMGSLDQIIDADIFRRKYTDPEGCGLAFALRCAIEVPAVRAMTGIVFLDAQEDVKRSDVAAVWGDAFAEINSKLNAEPDWKQGLIQQALPHVLRYDPVSKLVMPARELEDLQATRAAQGNGGQQRLVAHSDDAAQLTGMTMFRPNGHPNGGANVVDTPAPGRRH